ncbi:HAD hydrolase-like protein [Pedobacter psychroterrae]|uniref:HAD family hydrolase n=1 Tax=Pedobacter psychroterrae TaxID=2530453 RepID=A0A4R0NH02_9SPHI|nr:HAD family hydrolase [Pedobacter psychroterrae]TCC99840.1 HAD family hydrolase [Pedobacter psychroterrae]
MSFEKYLDKKEAFVFELDNVLYPEKDYLLQVYFLYAQFIEYAEQISASEIIKYVEITFLNEGKAELYEKTTKQFNIPEKYRINFVLLLSNARLPLKLLIFEEVLRLLKAIVLERKQIFIFTDGLPLMQLNKIKQMEWHGLEQYLTLFFSAETAAKPSPMGVEAIIDTYNLEREKMLIIGSNEVDRQCAENASIEFLNVDKLLLT